MPPSWHPKHFFNGLLGMRRAVASLAVLVAIGSGCSRSRSHEIPTSWIPFSSLGADAYPRILPAAVVELEEETGVLADLAGDGERAAWKRDGEVVRLTESAGPPIAGFVELSWGLSPPFEQRAHRSWTRPMSGSLVTGVDDVASGLLLAIAGRHERELHHDLTNEHFAKSAFLFLDRFPQAIVDLDGDGAVEVLIGAPDDGERGSLRAFSSETGLCQWKIRGPWRSARFGYCVTPIDDASEDGRVDLLVADPGWFPAEKSRDDARPGAVHLLSGRSREILYTTRGTFDDDYFGEDVAAVGDVDGDGISDFAVAAPGNISGSVPSVRSVSITRFGYVTMISGRDGDELWTVYGDGGRPWIAKCVFGVGDADGDGVPDVLVGGSGSPDSAWILSGSDGALIGALGWPAGRRGAAHDAYFLEGLFGTGKRALVVRVSSRKEPVLLLYDLGTFPTGD